MTCSYCGTELPSGAMFCGECGRPVTTRAARTAQARPAPEQREELVEPQRAAPPVAVDAAAEPEPEPEPEPAQAPVPADPLPVPVERTGPREVPTPVVPAPVVVVDLVEESRPRVEHPEPTAAASDDVDAAEDAVERCAQCNAPLAPSDIFCPECGFVRHRQVAARPGDTNVLDPFPWGLPRATEQPAPRPPGPEPEPVPAPAPGPAPVSAPSVPAPVPDQPISARLPRATGSHRALDSDDEADIEETRIVGRAPKGERFILQFSTGESVTVTGTGLIGRNPVTEPGEYVDSIVTITDPGKSVSKTHLEFGQEGGAFWISDRFSGNGTVVREPDRQPKRSDAGKRYRVVRGTRVDIGEQFFIVS